MKPGPRLLPRLLFLLCLGFALAGPIRADRPGDGSGQVAAPRLTEAQLDELLAPIALYPDALIALILPAATTPTEIVLAARYLGANRDPGQIDAQPWSESIRALARYAEIVKWMDENLRWTQQIGDAFLAQPADLMNAVQRLRARARESGALIDTPQQQIIDDGDMIEIMPAQPNVIYVPRYDPEVVYEVRSPGYYYPDGPYLTFGVGLPIGVWLSNDFDWRRREIWMGDRRHDWREHRDWRRQPEPDRPDDHRSPDGHPWRPPANRPPTPPHDFQGPTPEVVRPRLFPGTPAFPRPPRRDDDGRPDPRIDGGNRPPRTDNDNRPPRTDAGNRPPRTENYNPRIRPDENNRPPRPDRGNQTADPARPAGPAVNESPRNRPDRPAPAADQSAPQGPSQPRSVNPPNRPPSAQPAPGRQPPQANPPPAQRNPRPPPPPESKDRNPNQQEQER